MVIRYNNIYSHRLSQVNSFMACNSIIYGYNQGYPLLLNEVLVNTGIRTITICKTDVYKRQDWYTCEKGKSDPIAV